MNMLADPSMREIVEDFCKECFDLYGQLEDVLEKLEDDPLTEGGLENFGQIIDRIMGAANIIGAKEIATFCELGKIIGYKSSQIKDAPLLEIVVAVLFDALDLLRKMTEAIMGQQDKSMKNLSSATFVTRLHWLSDKFKDIERSSCAITKEENDNSNLSQNSIDDLLSNLGL